MRNNLWDWQELQPSSGPGTAFFKFCDALEVKNGESAPDSGWGVEHAVNAWGDYFKKSYLKQCKYNRHLTLFRVINYNSVRKSNGRVSDTLIVDYTGLPLDRDCVGTYNASQTNYTSTAIDNANRSWMWIV